MTSQINFEIKNKVATVLIKRSEVKNALNLTCISELIEVFEKVNSDPEVRCVILSGQGKEAFCSGADLKEFSAKNNLETKTEYFEALGNLILSIKNCDKPVISKVHGFALAGGLALVAASDIVLAANNAKFALPELKVGMVPGVVMLALQEVISRRALNYLSFSADVIDADEALQIGLVSKVYWENVLDEKARELAREISGFSKLALSTTKRMLYSVSNSALSNSLKTRAKDMAIYSLSPDCSEGIDAYLNKRKAIWK